MCEDMIAALEALQSRHSFHLEILDVEEDEALEARYGDLVPVLVGRGGMEICHPQLDHAALDDYLAGINLFRG